MAGRAGSWWARPPPPRLLRPALPLLGWGPSGQLRRVESTDTLTLQGFHVLLPPAGRVQGFRLTL